MREALDGVEVQAFAFIPELAKHQRILTMHFEQNEPLIRDDLRPPFQVLDEALHYCSRGDCAALPVHVYAEIACVFAGRKRVRVTGRNIGAIVIQE